MRIREAAKRVYEETRIPELPEEYELVAFQIGLTHLLNASGQQETSAADASGTTQRGEVSSREGWPTRAAQRLRIDPELLAGVFDADDAEPRIILPRSKLPSRKAPAMRLLALLLAGVRQAGGIDEGWTPTAVLREASRDFGVLDQANFASEVAAMDGIALRGTGARRELKITAGGFEALTRTLEELGG